jgi:hypothetical protein
MRTRPKVATDSYAILDAEGVRAEFSRHLNIPDVQQLQTHARNQGYELATGEETAIGLQQRWEAQTPVTPPRSASADRAVSAAAPVRSLESRVVIQSLTKRDSPRDQGAIVVATVSDGRNTFTQQVLLIAADGNFMGAREFQVQEGQLIETESWWSAIWACLLSKCGSVITGALVACSGTFIAYVGCVLAAAGGCGATCVACATCDCSWWCRWAAGCCDT